MSKDTHLSVYQGGGSGEMQGTPWSVQHPVGVLGCVSECWAVDVFVYELHV